MRVDADLFNFEQDGQGTSDWKHLILEQLPEDEGNWGNKGLGTGNRMCKGL